MDNKKFKRLNDRLKELNSLNENIGKLSFFIDDKDSKELLNTVQESQLKQQLEAMILYRNILQNRISSCNY